MALEESSSTAAFPAVDILACPETRQALRQASLTEMDDLRRGIASGAVLTAAGVAHKALENALIRADGRVAYRVEGGIPILLRDEAFELPAVPLQNHPKQSLGAQ